MINRIEALAQMRQIMKLDPSGDLLAQWIVEQKQLGLAKCDAQNLLMDLMNEFQQVTPRSDLLEAMEEGVAAVLDRVTGWCSHNHIYPE